MALINERHCKTCGHKTWHNYDDCVPCKDRKEQEAEQLWVSQTTDEKLLDLHRRLLYIERGPVKF